MRTCGQNHVAKATHFSLLVSAASNAHSNALVAVLVDRVLDHHRLRRLSRLLLQLAERLLANGRRRDTMADSTPAADVTAGQHLCVAMPIMIRAGGWRKDICTEAHATKLPTNPGDLT